MSREQRQRAVTISQEQQGVSVMMSVSEARRLAEELGYRLEKVRGEDRWIVRDLYTDVALVTSTSGKTFAETVRWLEKARRGQ